MISRCLLIKSFVSLWKDRLKLALQLLRGGTLIWMAVATCAKRWSLARVVAAIQTSALFSRVPIWHRTQRLSR